MMLGNKGTRTNICPLRVQLILGLMTNRDGEWNDDDDAMGKRL